MAVVDQLKFFGVDRYELNARLRPALFTALPVLVVAATWLPEVWTFLGGLTSLAVTCGVTMLMSRIARYRGRQLQARFDSSMGSFSTAAMLSHRDTRLDAATKARYHSFLRTAGHEMPSAADEASDRAKAGQCYRGCVTWLLEQTRDKKKFALLADENIDYGYRRNLFGLKPVAIPVLMLCLLGDAWAVWSHQLDVTAATTLSKGGAIAVCLLFALLAWLFIVTRKFVEDASDAYAIRLLAACDSLPKRKAQKAG